MYPKISIIVAIDKNNAIGNNNNLLCHLPNDLSYFKRTTLGKVVIMGRKTFESLPNGALPNRRNIVLSSNKDFKPDGCEIYTSLENAILACQEQEIIFIIGGASVYKTAIHLADYLYITEIEHTFEQADSFFPQINKMQWNEINRSYQQADHKNKYSHSFVIYERAGSRS